MKIATSNIALQSDHSKREQHYIAETLRVRNGDNISVETQRTYFDEQSASAQTKISLSEKAQQLLQNEQDNKNKNNSISDNAKANANLLRRSVQNNNAVKNDVKDAPEDPKLLLIRAIIEAITGKSIKLATESVSNQTDNANASTPTMANLANANGGEVIDVSAGGNSAFGLRYNSNEVINEKETTNFSAAGIITTADGKQIQFQCDLSMQRSFYMENSTEIFVGASTEFAKQALCDPLVINFAGTAAELKNTTFAFDLNADGKAENIQELAAGSAFLVLDKNGDGKVNDGNEMFGTQTGDGFADLAAYDEDGNGWIDENDSVYNSLGVWNHSSYGDQIRSLKQAGIGAIYLQSANTEFSIKAQTTNELQGQIRKTGIFINEKNGLDNISVGTIQHVDFAI